MKSKKELIRLNEAAEVYGCTRRTIDRHIKSGRLKVYTRYGVRLVSKSEVFALSSQLKELRDKRRRKSQM